MDYPKDYLYTKDHEWMKLDGDEATIGITDHAQSALGDIVFLELPRLGRELKEHEVFGVVESIKAVSDLYCPIGGTVTHVNEQAINDPSVINHKPYSEGWLIKLKISPSSKLTHLLDTDTYEKYVQSL